MVNRANRKLVLVFSYLAFVICFTVTIRKIQLDEIERRRPKPRPPKPEKLVLLWNYGPSNRPLWKPGVMKYLDNQNQLPHTCRVTSNRHALSEADMVVFHGIETQHSKQELAKIREKASSNTTFVLYMRNPPTYTGPLPESYNGFFDTTATYRYLSSCCTELA